MEWFNIFGFLFVVIMMIPNIVYAIKKPEGFENKYKNKFVLFLEKVGRIGCFIFMFINLPGTYLGFWSLPCMFFYIILESILLLAYIIIWIVCFNKNTLFRAIALSVIPSVMFLLGGILYASALLTIFAVIFAPCHILISVKNTLATTFRS